MKRAFDITARLVVALLPAAAGAAPLHAAAAAAPPWPATPPTLRTALQEARAALAPAIANRPIDTTPPVIHRFSLIGNADATLDGSGVTARLVMSDELSGIYIYGLGLTSPSGQTVARWQSLGKPQQRVAVDLALGMQPYSVRAFNRYSEPGIWKVDVLYALDAANNLVEYDAAGVAGFGRTEITVSNPAGFDATPPELKRGSIGSKVISLSKPPRGTVGGSAFPPFAYADLQLADSGNGQVAGVFAARMDFCRLDAAGACGPPGLSIGGTTAGPGLANALLRVGEPLREYVVPGTYQLAGMYLTDSADNYVMLSGVAAGGDVDFSRYFDGTTIVVVP